MPKLDTVSEFSKAPANIPPELDPVKVFKVAAPEKPAEKEYTLKLKRGYWPKSGTKFFLPRTWTDDNGIEQTEYNEDVTPEDAKSPDGKSLDEFARKANKLPPGALVVLPLSQAKVLLNAGKAEMFNAL